MTRLELEKYNLEVFKGFLFEIFKNVSKMPNIKIVNIIPGTVMDDGDTIPMIVDLEVNDEITQEFNDNVDSFITTSLEMCDILVNILDRNNEDIIF